MSSVGNKDQFSRDLKTNVSRESGSTEGPVKKEQVNRVRGRMIRESSSYGEAPKEDDGNHGGRQGKRTVTAAILDAEVKKLSELPEGTVKEAARRAHDCPQRGIMGDHGQAKI